MDRYSVERRGTRWIASDGARHAESDDPADAILSLLLQDEMIAKDLDVHEVIDKGERACRSALRLIQLITLGAEPDIVRNELRVLTGHINGLLD